MRTEISQALEGLASLTFPNILLMKKKLIQVS